MMETQFSNKAPVRDATKESAIFVDILQIELENEAHYTLHPFPADELEAVIQIELYDESVDVDGFEADQVESGTVQFKDSDLTANFHQNYVVPVIFEKIPKAETEINNDDDDRGCGDPNENIAFNGRDSIIGPELDLLANVDLSSSFSQTSQNTNPIESATRDVIIDADYVSHSHSDSPSSVVENCIPAKTATISNPDPNDSVTHLRLLRSSAKLKGNLNKPTVLNITLPSKTISKTRKKCKITLPPKLQCGLCLTPQNSADDLATHLEICFASHEDQDRRRFCKPCNKIYGIHYTYRSHALRVHGIKDVDSRPFQCDVCKRCFSHEESYLAHSALHQKIGPANDDALKHRPLKCPQCSSRFEKLNCLTEHVKSHKNERAFKCPKPNCKSAFNLKTNLRAHLRTVHSDIKPFKCAEPNCKKAFKTRNQLQKHQASHSAERPFKCHYSKCGGAYKLSESLVRHLALHSGTRTYKQIQVRPFKCGKCSRAFAQNWQLTKHLETDTHRKDLLFRCTEPNCKKKFKSRGSLKEHVTTIHMDNDSVCFKCPEPNCDKTFKTAKYLKDHLRGHTLPHKCRVRGCSAGFARPNLLSSHMESNHKKRKGNNGKAKKKN